MPYSNDDFVIYFAMAKAGYKRRPKETPVQYARRVAVEKLLLQRRYCDAFAQWKFCQHPGCCRRRHCRGDAAACLKRAMARVPHDMQRRAREHIVAATPRNIGAPEREARLSMPRDLYE